MSVTQNEKIRQVTDTTMVIGVDIASEIHWARAFDWRGLELGKAVKFENSAEGFNFFLRWTSELAVEQKKDSVMVGLEPTGHYWFTLAAHLQGGDFKLALVNPYHVKRNKELDDGHPSKSDKAVNCFECSMRLPQKAVHTVLKRCLQISKETSR